MTHYYCTKCVAEITAGGEPSWECTDAPHHFVPKSQPAGNNSSLLTAVQFEESLNDLKDQTVVQFQGSIQQLNHAIHDLQDNLSVCFQSLNETLTNLTRKIPTPPRPAMPSEELNRSAVASGSNSHHHLIGGSEAASSALVLGLQGGSSEGPNGGAEPAAAAAAESVQLAIQQEEEITSSSSSMIYSTDPHHVDVSAGYTSVNFSLG